MKKTNSIFMLVIFSIALWWGFGSYPEITPESPEGLEIRSPNGIDRVWDNQTQSEIPTNDTTTTTNATEPTSDAMVQVDLVTFFKTLFTSWWFYLILTIIILIISDYQNHPIVKVLNEHGKMEKLGRFIEETDDPNTHKKRLLFLSSTGLMEVYSNTSLRGMDMFLVDKYYMIEWLYPHVLLTKLHISGYQEKLPAKCWKNTLLSILFFIFRFTAFRQISVFIYEHMRFDEKESNTIHFLLPLIQKETLEYHFDVSYEQEEILDGKKEWQYIEKNEITYAEILQLKNLNLKNISIVFNNAEYLSFATLEQALQDYRSRLEMMSTYESRLIDLERLLDKRDAMIQELHETVQKLRLESDERVRQAIRPYEEISEYQRSTIPEILSETLRFRSLGISEQEALQKAILQHLDEQNKERKELQQQIVQLQAKLLAASQEKQESFDPFEIKIKEEKTPEGIKSD